MYDLINSPQNHTDVNQTSLLVKWSLWHWWGFESRHNFRVPKFLSEIKALVYVAIGVGMIASWLGNTGYLFVWRYVTSPENTQTKQKPPVKHLLAPYSNIVSSSWEGHSTRRAYRRNRLSTSVVHVDSTASSRQLEPNRPIGSP